MAGFGPMKREDLESESQMSEESVEGRSFLQILMLHWSGISNLFQQNFKV